MHLRYTGTFFRAQRRAAERRKILEAAFLFLARLVGSVERQITIIDRLQ